MLEKNKGGLNRIRQKFTGDLPPSSSIKIWCGELRNRTETLPLDEGGRSHQRTHRTNRKISGTNI